MKRHGAKRAAKAGRVVKANLKVPNGALRKWIVEHVNYAGAECLIWPFARDTDGRAKVTDSCAARAMCIAAHGEPPFADAHAAHNCGQGHAGCVHPEHLRWATPVENAADRLKHGTLGRKLTVEDVLVIRRSKLKPTELARRFGVSLTHVCRIQQKQSWKALS